MEREKNEEEVGGERRGTKRKVDTARNKNYFCPYLQLLQQRQEQQQPFQAQTMLFFFN